MTKYGVKFSAFHRVFRDFMEFVEHHSGKNDEYLIIIQASDTS